MDSSLTPAWPCSPSCDDQLIVESVRLAASPEQLPEPPDLDVTVGHAVLGPLNCRTWYLFLTLHDSDHTRQVRALRELGR